ncbi:YceI family protein [Spongiivirga citrea]|uniref:YceI family protein n=1 Tax=Spongiivirga citrea TaxID=1481457 RepID=A0A6M0CLR5_9FLAO|nr:YceI family protein [Spongiivirga citrea]NER18878.1 YceI family protein [Spongiivirga citrea]
MEKTKNQITQFVIWFALLFGVVVFTTAVAQTKYLDKNGVLIFEASEKLFEEVKAVNESVTVIFNEETNEIASLALIKGFRFKNSLMQEHFNENYIESGKYPKAIFKGKLVDFNPDAKKVTVKGTLEVRGKKKEIETTLNMQKVDGMISMTGEFVVSPSDFDIEIPKIVRNKIAREVNVKLDFKLERNDT